MMRFSEMQERLDAGLQPDGFGDFMGFRFIDHGEGWTVIEADIHERWINPEGVLHGGALSGLADEAMGTTMFTILPEDESCTNVDLSIKFLRATRSGTLRAESSVVKRGRTTCLIEVRILDPEGRLVARGESTFLRMPRRQPGLVPSAT